MRTIGKNTLPAGDVSEKKRILLVQYGHESSTVNPFTTGLERFGGREQMISGNPLADLGSFIPDFRAALAGRTDVEVVETVDAWANPWGRVERKVQETVKSILRGKIAAAGKLHGMLLMLHGAMVLEDDEDGEGDLLAFLRALVGPGVPIFAVLDLHARKNRAVQAAERHRVGDALRRPSDGAEKKANVFHRL